MMVSDEGRTQRIPICGENFRDTSLLYNNSNNNIILDSLIAVNLLWNVALIIMISV